MSDRQKISTIKKLRLDLTEANIYIKNLETKLLKDSEERGVHLDINTHNDLVSIMEEHNQIVMDNYPTDRGHQ